MFKTDYEKKRTEKVCHYDRRMERNFSLLVLKIFQNQLIDDGWLFVVNPMGSFINKDEMSIRAMPFRLFRKLAFCSKSGLPFPRSFGKVLFRKRVSLPSFLF